MLNHQHGPPKYELEAKFSEVEMQVIALIYERSGIDKHKSLRGPI